LKFYQSVQACRAGEVRKALDLKRHAST